MRPTVLAVVLCLALGACSRGGATAPEHAAAPVLHGAGATFPAPMHAYAPLPERLVPEIEYRLFAVHGPDGGYAGSQ